MPYARPTLSQLRDNALQQITTSGLTGVLYRSVLRVLGYMVAGMSYLHYAYQDWISLQSVPWTATDEYAAAWGALVGVSRKGPAPAIATIQFIGTVGASLPVGTPLSRNSDGAQFVTVTAGTVQPTGLVTVNIQAVVAGSSGQCPAGTSFTLSQPVNAILPSGQTTADSWGGPDQESDDAFRTRYLYEFSNPPQGGALTDYIEWAMAVSGVTRAWVTSPAPGTVTVYFMMDSTYPQFGGFPQGTNGVATQETRGIAASGDQLTLANAIYPERPVTALVWTAAPVAQPVNFTLAGLSPYTQVIKDAITAALTAMFMQRGTATQCTVDPSWWQEAIAAVPGIQTFTVVSPTSAVVSPVGYLPILGVVSYAGTGTAPPSIIVGQAGETLLPAVMATNVVRTFVL